MVRRWQHLYFYLLFLGGLVSGMVATCFWDMWWKKACLVRGTRIAYFFFLPYLFSVAVKWVYLHCEWEGCNSIADGPEQGGRVVGLSGMGSSMWRALCRLSGCRHESTEGFVKSLCIKGWWTGKIINHACATHGSSAWSVTILIRKQKTPLRKQGMCMKYVACIHGLNLTRHTESLPLPRYCQMEDIHRDICHSDSRTRCDGATDLKLWAAIDQRLGEAEAYRSAIGCRWSNASVIIPCCPLFNSLFLSLYTFQYPLYPLKERIAQFSGQAHSFWQSLRPLGKYLWHKQALHISRN